MICGPETTTLLRFLTAGSVDDGKSTLIGRLLYESQAIYEDQLASVRKLSQQKGGELDLSLITDGLRAEREQAITIDVAYRYFCTPTRKFILADTPGHEQYTRNMVTGASTANVAIVLVDARKGILPQTRRHTYIASLLGIQTLIVAVNKMDLVNFEQDVFMRIRDQYLSSIALLGIPQTYFVPISARDGDNVVRLSERTPWYKHLPLLSILETIPIAEEQASKSLRLPIQMVIRPNQDYRGCAGQIASGTLRLGDEVIALPSMQQARVTEIRLHKIAMERAASPMSVVVSLSRDVDLGRGDMLVGHDEIPTRAKHLVAKLIWMSESPLRTNLPYLIKHTSQTVCGAIRRLVDKIDMQSFENIDADTLLFNEVGTVELETHKAIFADPYSSNRTTGSFILIDPSINDTIAAGIIVSAHETGSEQRRQTKFNQDQRGTTVWFAGPGRKEISAIVSSVHTELLARGFKVEILDKDLVPTRRAGAHLSRSENENIHTIELLADLLARNGVIVLVTALPHYRRIQAEMRGTLSRYVEVSVITSARVCNAEQHWLFAERTPEDLEPPAIAPDQPSRCFEVRCNLNEDSVITCTRRIVGGILQTSSTQ